MTVTLLDMAITVAAYAISRLINRRFPFPFTVPVLLSTLLVMGAITLTGGGLAGYRGASDAITWWLGPAIVSLAVPLYCHRQVLIDHGPRVLAAVGGGTAVAMVTALVLSRLLGLDMALQGALVLKTATAPIGIALASRVGADAPIVAGMVVASALTGTIIGPALLTRLGVTNPLGRGMALGTISSGQGVAAAFREGDLTGATATVAMALAALAVALLAMPLATWLAT
ncbi:LrgB family protein [Cyanobium sp. HWJ4-Hawea]|uniref:LrgB family protein n=1 Tax=unclassified Cyanobium TaxID=2627006 RepID=UPI0020CB7B0A|nr:MULTISPECIES: LrgB family protein [unclassified Cyanobium]MCP9774869.1 LrgB family protein [Cyanobium sp. WAJ14-Wanaka]MCP9808952.1 LrgB family protein [Cyanobium sp. HWJ4-Hawea]